MGRRSETERLRQQRAARTRRFLLGAAVLTVGAGVTFVATRDDEPGPGPAAELAPTVRPTVAAQFPHDSTAFTQGLLVADGVLYESTGLYGASSLRRVDLATGAVLDSVRLGDAYFAEGLAALGGRLYQLTWREDRVFVWDQATLAPLDTLVVPGEAWGLATDGDRFVLSDGSDRLRWVDPATFATEREVWVRNGARVVRNLNELEVIDGLVYANVWQSGRIAVVDPADGAVVRWLDLGDLSRYHAARGGDVLNGVAFEPETRRLLVTGKLWPTLYALDF